PIGPLAALPPGSAVEAEVSDGKEGPGPRTTRREPGLALLATKFVGRPRKPRTCLWRRAEQSVDSTSNTATVARTAPLLLRCAILIPISAQMRREFVRGPEALPFGGRWSDAERNICWQDIRNDRVSLV